MIATLFRTDKPVWGMPLWRLAAGLALIAAPVFAGTALAEPARPIDGDLAPPIAAPASPPPAEAAPPDPVASAQQTPPAVPDEVLAETQAGGTGAQAPAGATAPTGAAATTADGSATWHKDDLIGAAEGVFGKGASGLAGMIEDLLKKQGEPNAYIVGREGGGALLFGLRYGSGTLFHRIEGQKPVYWTGPSIGFDAGANAASTFVLVYNLFDTEELYKRFGAGEGQAYLIGGFHVSYLRRGDKVLIPVRSGAGLRLGINAGYMKFSHKQNWLPF